jgi:1-acyl-sn-glycerol-3-phosphate acyltransferase
VLASSPAEGGAIDAQSQRIRSSRSPMQRNSIAACWMALRVWATVLHGLAQVIVLFPRLSKPNRDLRVQIWACTVLKRLGVELTIAGTPARVGPMLLVSNHISWLDIVVLHAVCHCRFVSKADVKRWPLIGTLATGGGTLYVERESRRDAMRIVHRMAEALRDGDILAVFPEGTTSDGASVLSFHSNLIQAAIWAGAPVQPVALQFVHGQSGTPRRDVTYMGDESLVGSIWRTLVARDLRAEVVFGTPQCAGGRDRRAWARELRSAITAMRRA